MGVKNVQKLVDPQKLQKTTLIKCLKYFCLFNHCVTLVVYSLAIICEACGVMTHRYGKLSGVWFCTVTRLLQ